MRIFALALLVGVLLALFTSEVYHSGVSSARTVSQLAFLASTALTVSLFSYLTGAKISTLLAFEDWASSS